MHIRFNRFSISALAAVLGTAISPGAMALTIFTCEPEWAALAGELAPDASITSATHARQDPHYIEARPSLIAQLRRADLAICTGAELEAGWLPVLQQRAANNKVQTGQIGMLFVSENVALLNPRDNVTRADGDVHAAGNPHLHMDPTRIARVAKNIADRLQTIDPERARAYQMRYDAWDKQWTQHIERWTAQAVSLRGHSVVAQHTSFAYLWQWLAIEQIADLEPKPGLPPTPAHLASLVAQVKGSNPIAIVQTLYQDKAPLQWLHERTGIAPLSLPSTVTNDGQSASLSGLFDSLISQLVAASAAVKR